MKAILFVVEALAGHRLRTALSALGVAIGVTAVILLTSLGEGTRVTVHLPRQVTVSSPAGDQA